MSGDKLTVTEDLRKHLVGLLFDVDPMCGHADCEYTAKLIAPSIVDFMARTNTTTELVEALREAETVFALVEHPAFPDPDYQLRIEALGSQIGYGALMAGASAAWRKSNIVEGSEFVAGPCQATVTRTLEIIRKALTLHDRGGE